MDSLHSVLWCLHTHTLALVIDWSWAPSWRLEQNMYEGMDVVGLHPAPNPFLMMEYYGQRFPNTPWSASKHCTCLQTISKSKYSLFPFLCIVHSLHGVLAHSISAFPETILGMHEVRNSPRLSVPTSWPISHLHAPERTLFVLHTIPGTTMRYMLHCSSSSSSFVVTWVVEVRVESRLCDLSHAHTRCKRSVLFLLAFKCRTKCSIVSLQQAGNLCEFAANCDKCSLMLTMARH